jgi:predicted component of type VI protein secretion system
VERASEPRQVAAALLDWREPAQDAVLAVENICADLVFQQVNLQQGALEGAQRLLSELSPQRIERELEEPRGRSALALFSSRYRGLWEEYAARHQDLEAARERFAELFGPEFTGAYRRYWDRGASASDPTE